MASIPFIDLQAQSKRLGASLSRAIEAAVEGGQWIMRGPQSARARGKDSRNVASVKHALARANGTDALMIVLRAPGMLGPRVMRYSYPRSRLLPRRKWWRLSAPNPSSSTCMKIPTTSTPASLGRPPLPSCPGDGKLSSRVVMPVDLFGQPADYAALAPIVAREKLLMLCDTAQGFMVDLEIAAHSARLGDASGIRCFFSGQAARLLRRWGRKLHQ